MGFRHPLARRVQPQERLARCLCSATPLDEASEAAVIKDMMGRLLQGKECRESSGAWRSRMSKKSRQRAGGGDAAPRSAKRGDTPSSLQPIFAAFQRFKSILGLADKLFQTGRDAWVLGVPQDRAKPNDPAA